MMAELWNQPLGPNVRLQQIQRVFNFRRVDVSLLYIPGWRLRELRGVGD
jgi:hypothetical protein